MMHLSAKKILAAREPDRRIDLLRGFATWFLFLDHIPNNVVSLLTLRNVGFSGATDVFVFVTGYASAIFFGQIAQDRGFLVAATRILRRMWQLYAAYIVLFVLYVAIISNVAARYRTAEIIEDYNILSIVDHPILTLMHGVILQAQPLHLDTLQLLIALSAALAFALWGLLNRPNWTLAASLLLYGAARIFGWSPTSFPTGNWFFNPLCWQMLFVLGGWFALNGARLTAAAHRMTWLRVVAALYIALAFVMAAAEHWPWLAGLLPHLDVVSLTPVDRENLALRRVFHLLALALLFTYFVPRHWPMLRSRLLQPVIACGGEWLSAFCVGVFLSFAGHLVLITGPDSVTMQILVSAAGIAIMTAVAYYVSWSRQQDSGKAGPRPGPSPEKRPEPSTGNYAGRVPVAAPRSDS